MASQVLEGLIKQADALTLDEQLSLIAHLAEKARQASQAHTPRRKWREIRGVVAYPMCGEDAQAWVSRSRREADEQREKQWRQQP
jgi:hypothetical protein